jgi:hypothetical protein
VTGAAARLTVEVAAAAAWVTVEAAALTVDVTGAAALLTLDAACETPAEAVDALETAADEAVDETPVEAALLLEPLELAGAVPAETTPLTVLTTLFTVPATAPSKPPDEEEAGDDEAGAARPVVAAWALEPDISQKAAISPRQQPASTRTREANRPTPLRPADSHVSGTAYSTPVQPP